MKIVEVDKCSEEILLAVNDLLPQLSNSAMLLSKDELNKVVSSEASHLLFAVENGKVFGMLTLVLFTIPTGTRAWIEDVVVREDARGKGVGKLLTQHAIELSSTAGAKTIDLTSRSSRVAANSLYKRLGFVERSTNIYRYET